MKRSLFLLLLSSSIFSSVVFAEAPKPVAQAPIIESAELPGKISVAKGAHTMVVASDPVAVKIADQVLTEGGNAVDAAVTLGFVMAVTYPRAGNLGGGGFMLVSRSANQSFALDYRERAPLGATKDMFLDEQGEVDQQKSRFSHLSAGVPGTVAGFLLALKKFGTLTAAEALAPAIRLAEEGFEVNQDWVNSVNRRADHLKRWPDTAAVFFKSDGSAYEVGELFKQPDLAKTLKGIAAQGRDGFYKGEVARLIASQMKANGGLINSLDLGSYQPALRKPVRGTYRGYEILSMPPPSSGGVHVVQILNVLERFKVGSYGANQTKNIHLMAETMKQAYADRSFYLGDADFVRVPVSRLISKRLAKQTARRISLTKVKPSSKIAPHRLPGYPRPHTTHFSVIDAKGMAVSNTYTLNFSFGSGVMVGGTGVLLNNEMDDFSAKPGVPNAYGLVGGKSNAIAPRKRMLSSMSPTIVRKNHKPLLITGSPGGSKIITTVVQVINNVIDHNMDLEAAVSAPRIHHQWLPDRIEVEPGIDEATLAALEKQGYEIKRSRYWGAANSILVDLKTGQRTGVADPRREGLALGH